MVSKGTKPKLVIGTTLLLLNGRLLANKFGSRNSHPTSLEKLLWQRRSAAYAENVFVNHAMGSPALGCVWILAFPILRSIAEQMDFALQTFDQQLWAMLIYHGWMIYLSR